MSNDNEYYYWPVCPYCEFEYDDTYLFDRNYDCFKQKCPECSKIYIVNLRVSYLATKIEGWGRKCT